MFRKDDDAIRSWGTFKTEKCAEMQRGILEAVHVLLKDGGHLLYSTCTFDVREDERMIREFMQKHPEYILLELKKTGGILDGLEGMPEAARLWPHMLRGEGHFTVMLQKGADRCENETVIEKRKTRSYRILKEIPWELTAFWTQNMNGGVPKGYYYIAGDGLYYLPCLPPVIDGLKVPKIGFNMGELNYEKFKPSQQFAMAFGADFKRKVSFGCHDEQLRRFLRGETLTGIESAENGMTAVCAEGYALGMGVLNRGILKNLYPKGWRRMI